MTTTGDGGSFDGLGFRGDRLMDRGAVLPDRSVSGAGVSGTYGT